MKRAAPRYRYKYDVDEDEDEVEVIQLQPQNHVEVNDVAARRPHARFHPFTEPIEPEDAEDARVRKAALLCREVDIRCGIWNDFGVEAIVTFFSPPDAAKKTKTKTKTKKKTKKAKKSAKVKKYIDRVRIIFDDKRLSEVLVAYLRARSMTDTARLQPAPIAAIAAQVPTLLWSLYSALPDADEKADVVAQMYYLQQRLIAIATTGGGGGSGHDPTVATSDNAATTTIPTTNDTAACGIAAAAATTTTAITITAEAGGGAADAK